MCRCFLIVFFCFKRLYCYSNNHFVRQDTNCFNSREVKNTVIKDFYVNTFILTDLQVEPSLPLLIPKTIRSSFYILLLAKRRLKLEISRHFNENLQNGKAFVENFTGMFVLNRSELHENDSSATPFKEFETLSNMENNSSSSDDTSH